jgi:hypothetical protein
MTGAVVRYRVKPGRGEENAALVEAVYAELEVVAPEGFRYATFVLDDGVSFVHTAFTAEGSAPLPGIPAFQRFQAGLGERCADPPEVTRLGHLVGTYRM